MISNWSFRGVCECHEGWLASKGDCKDDGR
jgi:hypothetical protein